MKFNQSIVIIVVSFFFQSKLDRMRLGVFQGGASPSLQIHTLVFFYILILSLPEVSISADTLTPDQTLKDGQALVSSNQVFELGFFRPGSSGNQYLGIWYKNIPLTVVWVANRENPIKNFSGSLTIGPDKNLVLLQGNGSIVWSADSQSAINNPVAQILDNGNFVLREESGDFIWQSFDFPTDTLLPDMKQGKDLKTGLNRKLTSWKDQDDPSVGDYSYGVEIDHLPQLVLRMGSKELYRSGVWYEDRFSGGPALTANSVFKPIFVSNSDEVYYMYEPMDPSLLSRIVLSQSSIVQQFKWNSRQNQWDLLFTVQKDNCDTYNVCGPFGVCDPNASSDCKCMEGFVPKSPHDWELFDFTGGCVRTSPLDCRGDGFWKYNAVKLPDALNVSVRLNMTSEECGASCSNDCSCTGYAVMDSNGKGKGCLNWSGDLIDIRKASDGYGQDLYVRLSASTLKSLAVSPGRKRRRLKVIIIVASSVLSVLFLLCSVLWFLIWSKRKKKIETNRARQTIKPEEEEDREFPSFDVATIAAATNNFSLSNKIGEGGFGPVYKGILPTGQQIAVKRLSQNSRQGLKELRNEVLLISKLQHRNLVKLLGCCIHGEERMLIYEFMANRSLDVFIFDPKRRIKLEWRVRFDIVVGIARGILYLHRDSRLRIIHRDLKASNILLDNEMNPKISDFGLARTFGGDQSEEKTRVVVGTYGYMSPEYAVDGNFSIKSDVFSYGVLILEILSGRKNRGFCDSEHDLNLLGHAWKLWDEERALELIDGLMGDNNHVNEAVRCLHVGLLCVQRRPEDRPTMSTVLMMLDGDGTILQQPNQPGFFTQRSPSETDSTSRNKKSGTSDDVTVTLLQGR